MVIKVSKLERILKERKSYPAVNILELEVPPVHPGEILREEFVNYSALADGASGRDRLPPRRPAWDSCFSEGWLISLLQETPPVPSPQA